MEEYYGKKYVLVDNENFDEYLKFIGYGYLLRTAASRLKPIHCLVKNDDGSYTFSMESLMMTTSIQFREDEEFDERKPPDGEVVKSTITFDENKMIHKQRESNGRTSTHIREFYSDKMIVRTTVDGWPKVAVRNHELVPQR